MDSTAKESNVRTDGLKGYSQMAVQAAIVIADLKQLPCEGLVLVLFAVC